MASVEVKLMPLACDWRRAIVALKALFANCAATRLPMLEQPFTDFYRAFDAWRGTAVQPLPAQRVIFASNGAVPVGGSGVAPLPSAAPM